MNPESLSGYSARYSSTPDAARYLTWTRGISRI